MNANDEYVATVMVLAYGRTTILNLNSETSKCFDNTRLYQISRKLDYSWAKCIYESGTKNYLKHIFRRNLVDKNTFDVIQEYIDHSTPRYIELQKEADLYVDDNIGQLYDPVTFDKVIHTFGSTANGNSFLGRLVNRAFIESGFGVFLISVHKKVIHENTNMLELVYPVENDDTLIDLLNLDDYSTLSEYFPDRIQYIDAALAKISREKKPSIPDNIKSHEKPIVFNEDKTNKIFIQDDFIRIARLSYIPYILKTIFGSKTYVNIMDYSCSVLPDDFPEKEKIYTQYIRPTHTSKMTDLEMGSSRKIGGRKTIKSALKKRRGTKKKRTVRFSNTVTYKKIGRNKTTKKKKNKRHKKRRSRRRLGGTTPPPFPSLSDLNSALESNNDRSGSSGYSELHQQARNTTDSISSYGTESSRDSEHSIETISSLGDFEVEELDELRSIITMIHTHIFFNYVDSGYNEHVLNVRINGLETYDLHRRVEYIIDEVQKMDADTVMSQTRKRDVLQSLNIILDLIPNTRTPTPSHEFLGGKKIKNRRK